ncbi:MAG: hypothetical protein K0Q50_2895 [Vampirovibrio sp.]|jgi:hypothetical protein|nr:hypothetical protein [Vampirovibrio sp.]
MKRFGNVLEFPTGQASSNGLKLFAVIFYLFLAYTLTFGTGLSEEGLWVLFLLGPIYNFFVRQRIHQSGYFQQNKVLLIILLAILILAFKWIMILLLLLAGVYWLLVGRSGREAPYFLRFHILTGLILNFFILMPYLMINSGLALVYHVSAIFHAGTMVASMLSPIQAALPMLFMGIFWGAAIWLSISALIGRTPYIGIVTPNVRHWS